MTSTHDAHRHLRILLSAYACEPDRGSEPGVGWQWMLALLRRGHEVTVLTRANNQGRIEAACQRLGLPIGDRLHFIYHDMPGPVLTLKRRGLISTQVYYQLWQWGALGPARHAHAQRRFDVCHHLTFGVWRQPSRLHALDVPFIYGPVGGGEDAPWSLVRSMAWQDQLRNALRRVANQLALLHPGLRRCICRSSRVLAKTPQTAGWIARLGGQAHVALEIGVLPQQVRPAAPTRAAADTIDLLSAGRLVGLKGVHLAIRACALARARGVDVRLTIVGQGPEEQRLRRLAKQNDLDGHVTFVPWLTREQLDLQYASADALIFPSLHDSSGNVVLEAMSHGLPVICLQLGGPAVMVDGSNGLAVAAPAGIEAEAASAGLAEAIQRLSSDRGLRNRLSEGALRTARSMTWDAAAAQAYGGFEECAARIERRPLPCRDATLSA